VSVNDVAEIIAFAFSLTPILKVHRRTCHALRANCPMTVRHWSRAGYRGGLSSTSYARSSRRQVPTIMHSLVAVGRFHLRSRAIAAKLRGVSHIRARDGQSHSPQERRIP
jgi:hypothetical protein